MTFDTVRKIMKENNIWPYSYSVDEHKPLAELALCVDKKGGKYRFYIHERTEIYDECYFNTEAEVCNKFMREMAFDHPSLRKYL